MSQTPPADACIAGSCCYQSACNEDGICWKKERMVAAALEAFSRRERFREEPTTPDASRGGSAATVKP